MKNQLKKMMLSLLAAGITLHGMAQNNSDKSALKLNLNENGSHYFQLTVLNQVWMRYNQSNPGTLIDNKSASSSFDIGLRRTRMQLFGQINDRVFIYFQFGENNINAQTSLNGNRKLAAFFHDAVCEYRVTNNNALKLGAGLTIANGLSRFSQPSIATIMTMDVPVFAQTTVDQTDQFSRKLSMYARGQLGHLDYRFMLSDPFNISSNGTTPPAISSNASFAQYGHTLQQQAYVMYQFLDQETHTTPYMTGTYLGKKKVFNIAAGAIYQKDAMWLKSGNDTLYKPMMHWCIESFLDMPCNAEKQSAINAYVGYFNTNYGNNYLRYNGIMNPATSSSLTSGTYYTGDYGNAVPMFGTGHTIYAQIGYLLPINSLHTSGRWMPYASATSATFDRLNGNKSNTFNAGINYLIQGHNAKITLDWQNRPTFAINSNGNPELGDRRNAITLQYQVYF